MRRAASLLLIVSFAVLPLGCKPKPAPASVPAPAAVAPQQEKPAPNAPHKAARGPSIYQLHAALIDQDGKSLALDAFRGHPVIISMFYSSCKAMCPLLITHLHGIEAALSPDARAQTHFLLVSLDPERDTPESLKKLATEHAVDTLRWSFTRTPAGSVQELAAVLGVRYRRLPTGELVHSSIITVLDREGAPVLRVDDADQKPAEIAEAVRQALAPQD